MFELSKRWVSLLLAIIVVFSLNFSKNRAQEDVIVVLANSIDFPLAEDFVSGLEARGYRVIHVTAEQFQDYKELPIIVILGGHKAPEGVGPIVDQLLSEDVKQYLETRGNYGMFLVFNPYAQGQVIWIIAGNDRNLTRLAHSTYGELVGPTPFPQPEVNLFRPESAVVGGIVFFELSDVGGSLLPIAKAEYFDGTSWVLIGEDDGFDPDYDVERSTRTIMWDTYGLPSGWYIIKITLYDLIGQTGEIAVRIYVDQPPIPQVQVVSYNPETGYVSFDASESYDPDGEIVEWVWDFGDGKTAEGPIVEHHYDLEYLLMPIVVSVTLADDKGISEKKEYVFSNGSIKEEFVPEVKAIREKIDKLLKMYEDLKSLSDAQTGELKELLSDASSSALYAGSDLTYPLTDLVAFKDIDKAIEGIEKVKSEIKNIVDTLSKAKDLATTQNLRDQIQSHIDKLHEIWIQLQFVYGKLNLIKMIGTQAHGAEIDIPNVRIGDGSYYTWCTSTITLLRSDVWDTDVILHELDHYIWHEKAKNELAGGGHWIDEHLGDRKYKEYLKAAEDMLKAAGLPPNVPQAIKDHLKDLAEEEGKKLALSEGWAHFSMAVKQKDPEYWDKEPGNNDDVRFDIEKGKYWKESENKWVNATNKGEDVELSIAGILWDLFDGAANGVNDQDNDGVSIDFKHIWCAINEKKDSKGKVVRSPPNNIKEFYKNLIECLKEAGVPYDKDKVDKVFKDHGVTP